MGRRRTPLRGGSIQRRALFAVERARTRLAIAFATESKRTTAMRWQTYVATDDRMRRFIRRLRGGWDPAPSEATGWIGALEALESLPPIPLPGSPQGGAQLLCQRVCTALEILEGKPEAQSCLKWIMLRDEPESH